MIREKTPGLLSLVQSFFREHLESNCGASPHTIRAYRDALRLLFRFMADKRGCAISDLRLEDLTIESIQAFLAHLEIERGNTPASRNCRLTAIRGFFKHLIRHDLSRGNQYYRVIALPSKRSRTSPAHYLEPEDVRLILQQPDRRTVLGARDHALLLFLYNTGARVSEALSVRVQDLSLLPPRQVYLQGKRKKVRHCPLWGETATSLQHLSTVRDGRPNEPIFRNRYGHPLTRDGVAYILQKYAKLASRDSPGINKHRIAPHLLRHSCAVALLQAGVDVTVIRDYLGHSSISTTSRYITTNLQMKQDALEAFWRKSGLVPGHTSPWKPKPDLLTFLESL
ncbi:tyrosine-type recombinase/integrase [Haliea sp. E1-2-M8]|uniref:tyrosine-type recombinase/integrase n=1 Tax=Haliea sp. E1-2-M8 TaxID=3064706 RepID=UPI002717DD28|nr:tyrosine-type recombinase/integrase [Haliea sp. E1-2-M8]MDO8863824.1 tyrosine-type recombinase/integrase [Haliea sp. E1-2-M8]